MFIISSIFYAELSHLYFYEISSIGYILPEEHDLATTENFAFSFFFFISAKNVTVLLHWQVQPLQ
jgi:hypothetical protein